MADGRHLPNVLGCAVGFSAAGSGVGSLVGLAVGSLFFPQPVESQSRPHEQIMAFYGGTIWGIVAGMGVGLFVGVWYAVATRRSRLRVRAVKAYHN